MEKAIMAFILADLCLSLIAVKIPLFRQHNSKKWEEETYLQRFCYCFFPSLIGFLLCVAVYSYKSANEPNSMEKALESGEWKYVLVTDINEIGDADIVYEISKGKDENEISQIIADICRTLEKTSDQVEVYFEYTVFMIKDHNVIIGNVAVSEKKYGMLLKFRWGPG